MPAKKASKRLIPKPRTVIVRMYRIGHGDCFLLAYGRKRGGPFYVLIDCGYKPGSNAAKFINTKPADVVRSIGEATGKHLNVVVITHEHQDHVNAISPKAFEGFRIDQAWFAWTEDAEDDLANELRDQYHDTLLQLANARDQLAADAGPERERIDEILEFSLGGDERAVDFAAAANRLRQDRDTSKALNKQAMKVFKDLAKHVAFLSPHGKPLKLANDSELRVFVLGPPRHGQKLMDEDPVGGEGFPRLGLAADGDMSFLAQAMKSVPDPPFAARYCVPIERDTAWQPMAPKGEWQAFYQNHYGVGAVPVADEVVEDNALWRRIDSDWLYSASQLALKMSNYINNTSLVLAFELGAGGKVLLFAADAQRGNWISWTDADFKDGDRKVTTRDLLSRTVLYKVGHHGSHNATLDGGPKDDYANLFWMGEGEYASEFTAMITAVRKWAQQPSVQWDHPLKSIKDALMKKACGRVFQTDTDFAEMTRHPRTPEKDWSDFQSRASGNELYFEYHVNFS